MIGRLRGWWKARRTPPADWCDECQTPLRARDRHTLTSEPKARAVEGARGWTAVSCDYCGEHCPGGCDRGCLTRAPV